LRLAILGAFPFPLPQGSQAFAHDHARALEAAGARVTFFCYGSGQGGDPAGLSVVRVPGVLSSKALRAGPTLRKPVSDAALAAVYVRAHREQGFDAAIAHNVEAVLAAAAARVLTGVPVIYLAHTLMENELASFGPERLRNPLKMAGAGIDRAAARSADAVIALCEAARVELSAKTRAPVRVIPPGLDPAADPSVEDQARACARAGVEPARFVLYAGNLDRYQNLDELEAAARRVPELPIVVATHAAPPDRASPLRFHPVESRDDVRALTFAAGVTVLPRRRRGGFPIKLLNYMEARRAIVARGEVAESLEHDRNAWLLPAEAGDCELAEALAKLMDDRDRARRLGEAARERLESHHAWPLLATRTLSLVGSAVRDAKA